MNDYRVAVLNLTGNVGKTTIARFLLKPRMPNAGDIIYIETHNADKETKEGAMVKSSQFERVSRLLMERMSAIVDIGSSNAGNTLEFMRTLEGSHQDIDYYLLPVTKKPKQRSDTIRTMQELVDMGVEPERIKVIFNLVDDPETLGDDFNDVIYAMKNLGIEFNPKTVLRENIFFSRFQEKDLTLDELFATTLEQKMKRQNELRRMANRTDKETQELRELNKLATIQRAAATALRNLDEVFDACFGKDDFYTPLEGAEALSNTESDDDGQKSKAKKDASVE